jgi:hypothetical protein
MNIIYLVYLCLLLIVTFILFAVFSGRKKKENKPPEVKRPNISDVPMIDAKLMPGNINRKATREVHKQIKHGKDYKSKTRDFIKRSDEAKKKTS